MSMKTIEARLLLDAKAQLGEGPVWHEEEQALYWVDIPGKKLHRTTPDALGILAKDQEWDTPMQIGCYAFTKDGRILGAGQNGFGYLELKADTAEFLPLLDPEAHKPYNRFNDGKCDASGRFYAGSMASRRDGQETPGAFYVLDTDGECRKLLEPVGTSNGLAWSADNRTLYYIDTPTQEVSAFDYDETTGDISNRRVAVHFDEDLGRPDGMTIDENGNLWVAFFGGAKVRCVDPRTGTHLAEIPIPSQNVTSCCFGGPDYTTLFITTARIHTPDDKAGAFPNAGGIFAADPGVRGFPLHRFGND